MAKEVIARNESRGAGDNALGAVHRAPGILAIVFLFSSFLFPNPVFSKDRSAPAVFQNIPSDKPLEEFSRFIVVDDFNSGKFKKRLGAEWQIKAPNPGALDLSLDKQDGRNKKRGYSLKADFRLLPAEAARFSSFLEYLDVSQASFLVFKVKLEARTPGAFTGRIRVVLSDWRHSKVVRDITEPVLRSPKGWVDIVIPIKAFQSLELDQLFTLSFDIVSRQQKIAGSFWLDEIAFSGPENVSFHSHRDNIVGYPAHVLAPGRKQEVRSLQDERELLKAVAQDTWKYFLNARDRQTHLIVDHLRMGEHPLVADYTSPTNIAMDLLSVISAMDLEFISPEQARDRVKLVLNSLEKMRRYKGFFYNFYETKQRHITRSYISTVDSGWLASALVVVRQAFPGDVADKATKILDGFTFNELLDPENNQLVIGIDVPERNFGTYHYGMLASEARLTSLYAIGKGDIPPAHWWFLFRTPPDAWSWQNQKPQGPHVLRDGVDYVQGYYRYEEKKFVPSWGGSLFEYLMPTLLIDEKNLAPKGLGLNDRIAVEIQRDYALYEKKYPVWGISPAAVSNGRQWNYVEMGIQKAGVKGYPDRGVVTPHVSFLALDILPQEALANIRNLLKFEIYGDYGFYDSLNLKNRKANPQYLALDQGMILVAICNYLKEGSIQSRFLADPVGQKAGELLKEDFFKEP